LLVKAFFRILEIWGLFPLALAVCDEGQKRLVDTGIFAEFGMKGCRHGCSLSDRDGIIAFCGKNFYAVAYVDNLGGTDEDHFQRRRVCTRRIAGLQVMVEVGQELPFPDRAIDLAAVCVAANANVQGAKPSLSGIFNFCGEQDRSGAGAESWFRLHELLELFEPVDTEQLLSLLRVWLYK